MAREIETEAGRRFAETLNKDALRQIQSWALTARDALDVEARQPATEKACKIGDHFNDAAVFGALADAIKPFLPKP